MGFNISGLAINKNYEDDFEVLQNKLGWNLKKQSEIDFDTASSNWKEEGICDVYFTDKGTLMFLNIDMCTQAIGIENQNTLTFGISETSMTFILNYSEDNKEIRSIMESDGERFDEEGEILEVEKTSQDTSEILWNQIETVIGKSFWGIGPDEKATRYIFLKETKPDTAEIMDFKREQSKPIAPKSLNEKYVENKMNNNSKSEKKFDVRVVKSETVNRKWWQFWK